MKKIQNEYLFNKSSYDDKILLFGYYSLMKND